jgi:hypothetical protein
MAKPKKSWSTVRHALGFDLIGDFFIARCGQVLAKTYYLAPTFTDITCKRCLACLSGKEIHNMRKPKP